MQETLKTKNIKRFLKIERISNSAFYTWFKKYKNTGTVFNCSTRPKTSPNIFNNQKVINLIIKLYTEEYRGKHYIKAYLNRKGIKIGVTAVENVLKRNNLWKYKINKKKKRYDKRKFVSKIVKEWKIVQIDTNVDLAARYNWRQIYEDKIFYSALSFLKYVFKTSPFKIQSIQIATKESAFGNNGTEFTYRKHSFDSEHPLDIFCKKNYIKRVYSPVASPCYNDVVESKHRLDQKQFYDFCTKELTLKKANLKLRKYNNFFNYKQIHSALNYDTPMLYFKKLRNS